MHYRTVKSIVENEIDMASEFTLCGIIIDEDSFEGFLENVKAEILEEIHEKYAFISTNNILCHPDGFVLFGRFINDLDENKTIAQSKSEMMDDFLKYGLFNNNLQVVSKGVVFLSGILVDNDDIEDAEVTEQNESQVKGIEEAIKKERSEL
jgi:hypothetical protein